MDKAKNLLVLREKDGKTELGRYRTAEQLKKARLKIDRPTRVFDATVVRGIIIELVEITKLVDQGLV